jgi:hypothetical protein
VIEDGGAEPGWKSNAVPNRILRSYYHLPDHSLICNLRVTIAGETESNRDASLEVIWWNDRFRDGPALLRWY